jgi:hypothetical protein
MLRFSLIHHRRTTKTCSVFLPLPSVYRSNRPVTGTYRAVYRSEPNELAFQFGIWIWSVFNGNRGLPTGLPKPTAGGSGDRFAKLNPGSESPHSSRPSPPFFCHEQFAGTGGSIRVSDPLASEKTRRRLSRDRPTTCRWQTTVPSVTTLTHRRLAPIVRILGFALSHAKSREVSCRLRWSAHARCLTKWRPHIDHVPFFLPLLLWESACHDPSIDLAIYQPFSFDEEDLPRTMYCNLLTLLHVNASSKCCFMHE